MPGASTVATGVWLATPELVIALDERFGEPLDTYVNGSQVWIREDGPGSALLEWRLHPVAGYRRPAGLATEEVLASVALALATGREPPAPLLSLWDGLEAFGVEPDDLIEPQPLAASAAAALGSAPDAVGLVDHETIAARWEATRGGISIVAALLDQLGAGSPPSRR